MYFFLPVSNLQIKEGYHHQPSNNKLHNTNKQFSISTLQGQSQSAMETVNSFKGYGKVDLAEDLEFRRRTRRRLIIIVVSSVLLVLLIFGAVIGFTVSRRGSDDRSTSSTPSASTTIKHICAVTLHPDSCYTSLMAVMSANSTITDPEELFKISLRIAMNGFEKIRDLPEKLAIGVNDTRIKAALQVCGNLVDDSIDLLNDTLLLMEPTQGQNVLSKSKIETVRTWLSAVMADSRTCLDELDDTKGDILAKLEDAFRNSTEYTSNSLAMVTKFISKLESFGVPFNRKLLGTSSSSTPYWVKSDTYRRRLLQSTIPPAADAVVATDGSGQFTTITEALSSVPKKSPKAFVIYVKTGKYMESVVVDKNMWNVMMIGDGMDKTIVSGSKNVVDGTPTFLTAPFIVEGRGFLARDMGFENTAGPEKHQAVAVRAKADHVIFYRCSFDAFQDTLYTHSLRQFYRECDVLGTIDFIFGDASVVFQKCNIRPRQPLTNQQNTITAQGRTDPNENTGISIQGCTISEFDKVTMPTYLGRPWKPYSTTVFMGSELGAVVDSKGWQSWDGVSNPPPTIFYGEYQNTGPGSTTVNRVNWEGYKPSLTEEESQRFTIGPFVQGNEWLPSTGVAFDL